MFDRELFKHWLAALRSGKYQQCQDFLHRGDGFCCLGVACDVAGLEWFKGDSGIFRAKDNDRLASKVPPLDIQIRIGIDKMVVKSTTIEGVKFKKGRYIIDCLTEMNDSGGYSFEAIANMAEGLVNQSQGGLAC